MSVDNDGMDNTPICIDCKRVITKHDGLCEVWAADNEALAIKILERMAGK